MSQEIGWEKHTQALIKKYGFNDYHSSYGVWLLININNNTLVITQNNNWSYLSLNIWRPSIHGVLFENISHNIFFFFHVLCVL